MLQIKNIRQYRKFYKEEVRDLPTRDEDFIGNYYMDPASGKKKFGWFEIYHGDKEGYGKAEAGIENFLQSFLDMARDGQAVYEFLQNAVDAHSTHFTMAWGTDETDGNNYLLVANNGEMFSFNSVRSILNVGSSTKSADSQTIGKFGIGFKLAHRLVGKDNGLQELLNENSGPILFSWKNHELAQLAAGDGVLPMDMDIVPAKDQQYEVLDTHPWLFKILITCFPCLPENKDVKEQPRLVSGDASLENPFSGEELAVMSRWVARHLPTLDAETYKEGALFFIKLGKGKDNDLADQNLREGVRFSLAILNKTADKKEESPRILTTVQLNDGEPISMPDLNYLTFRITKADDLPDYIFIRFGVKTIAELQKDQLEKLDREADIEVLTGFRKYDGIGDHFAGAPNFYLYFPLSEEVHNFNYILHCNAFYKGSSRTFLHKGTKGEEGINERLLTVIAARFFEQLKMHAQSAETAERLLFLDLYAALLSSGQSSNQERLWIVEPYIDKLTGYLAQVIPVEDKSQAAGFSISLGTETVYIKATKIGVGDDWLTENVKWFFWGNEFPDLQRSAGSKLGLQRYDIFTLLQNEGVHVHLNNWMKGDPQRIGIVLEELSFPAAKELKTEAFIKNLASLEILAFSDGKTMSLQELDENQEAGYLILHNTLSDIRDLLLKCGFKVSILDFNDYDIIEQYQSWLSTKSQLRGHTAVTRLFSECLEDEAALQLSPDEKFRIFSAFRDLNEDNRVSRISELKLYQNKKGDITYFKNLLLETGYDWLQPYCIREEEYQAGLRVYLTEKDGDLYERIVYPFWKPIAGSLAADLAGREKILQEAAALFLLYQPKPDARLLLNDYNLLFFQNRAVEITAHYYTKALQEIPQAGYPGIQDALDKFLGIQLPDLFFLPFAEQEPFKLNQDIPELSPETLLIGQPAISKVLDFCGYTGFDLFGARVISRSGQLFALKPRGERRQYFTGNPLLIAYAGQYAAEQYQLLPAELAAYASLLDLNQERFALQLIAEFKEDDLAQELDLVEGVLTEGKLVQEALFNKLTTIGLDTGWTAERQNQVYLRLLAGVFEKDPLQLEAIGAKVQLETGGQGFYLKEIDQASDIILLKRGEKEIAISQAELLDLEDKQSIKLIRDFAAESIKRNLVTENQASAIFKLSGTGVTAELVQKFLACLTEKQLVNSHQLAFVLFSEKFKKETFKEFQLQAADGELYELGNIWVLWKEDIALYDPKYVFGGQFKDFGGLISLGASESFQFGMDDKDILLPGYLFVKGCGAEILNEEAEMVFLLDGLLAALQQTPNETKLDHDKQDWEKILKFSPAGCVMHPLSTPAETLPEEVTAWLANGEKTAKLALLRNMGVSGPKSRIARLRNWLLAPASADFQLTEIHQVTPVLLVNTLKVLAGETLAEQEGLPLRFTPDDQRVKLLETLAGILLEAKITVFPVAVYHTAGMLEFKDPEKETIYHLEEPVRLGLSAQGTEGLDQLYGKIAVAWMEPAHSAQLLGGLTGLGLMEERYAEGGESEHAEPYYKRWQEEQGITLIRVDRVMANVFADVSEEWLPVGVLQPADQVTTEESEDRVTISHARTLSLEDILEIMERDEEDDICAALKELIRERDKALAGFYQMMAMAGSGEGEDAMYKALQRALAEQSSRNEREGLLEEMGTAARYSYQWFKVFMEYLLTFEQVADTTTQKSLSFQKISGYLMDGVPSEKYFMLYGAGGLVPVNIDAFLDFSLTLVFRNGRKETIRVDGASGRGQDVLIYCPGGLPAEILGVLEQVANISMAYSPTIDLLRQLYNAFANPAVLSPWDDIMEALPPVEFIYGPPGTGKTTAICELIKEQQLLNPGIKCLVLAPTNKAADVVVRKLLTPDSTVRAVRLGSATDPELEAMDEEVYQKSLTLGDMDYYHVVACTVHRLPYFKVYGEPAPDVTLFQLKDHWDLVIIDEASMVSLPYLVFTLMSIGRQGRAPRFIVAGDPMQIPPVMDLSDKDLEELDVADQNVYTMMGIQTFKADEQTIRPIDQIRNLDTQYRSIEAIGQLYSRISYQGQLKHGRDFEKDPVKILPPALKAMFPDPVSFINFPLNSNHPVFEHRKLLYSSYHLYAGLLVAELLDFFSKCDPEENWSIGVITPYKAQALITNKLIRAMNISEKLTISCNTVHSFQGDQCDLVIFLVNPNSWRYTGHYKSLLTKEFIYNVAISRARDHLWILNPFHKLNNDHVNKIRGVSSEVSGKAELILHSSLEKGLFNQADFLETYTFLTGHDNINIYGDLEKMEYFIRLNDFAVDVQLPGIKGKGTGI